MSRSNAARIENIRHSLAHLLAQAVLEKFPEAKLGIGPAIEDGFYYDFDVPRGFTPEDLEHFEERMRHLIEEALPIRGKRITAAEARSLFKSQPYKLELIKEFAKQRKTLTAYSTGDTFTDLCRGGHVKNTKDINPNSFRLTSIAGAYWKGNEKNPQLQRIYGVAFKTKKELDQYLKQQEEIKKRDHRVLGKELDLFLFSDLVGAGLPLFTPKGTLLRDTLDNYVWELRRKREYQRVDIPHLTKKDLYVVSGHWDKFSDDLFKIKTREGHLFAVKPMNCPHHIQIFSRKSWSYRELPQRYANTTKVYRDEQTGELQGLSRVRSITQDDAHVFCSKSQLREEFLKIWDIVNDFYSTVGFNDLRIRLSLRNPKEPQKYIGDAATWREAEQMLKSLAKERGVTAEEALGEAAFYGPKIDFIAKDSLGRAWQVATIQLDFNLPKRFHLTYINEKGTKEDVFMIHAAIMGAIERFLSILIEHYAGAFPVWLSPVQVQVIPISRKQDAYARKVATMLEGAGVRAETTASEETVGKRIRDGEIQKIPYLLVVGEKEQKSSSVAVRKRGKKDIKVQKLTAFIDAITQEIKKKK